MKKFILVLIMTLFATSSIAGYRAQGFYSCGKVLNWSKENDEIAEMLISQWFLGYYTARNYVDQFMTDNPPDDVSVYYAILKYCRENPLKDTDDASIKLYQQLTN
jgi:hypothetical protein